MVDHSTPVLGMLYGLSEVALSVFKRSGPQATSKDGGSLQVLWVVILVSLAAGFVAARLVPQAQLPSPEVFHAFGTVAFLLGLALRSYAIIYLGRLFTVNVAIARDHPVIDTGPYKYVRHPAYTGALLAMFGLALCTTNAATILIVMIPITSAFYRRIQAEETALCEALGPAYSNYAARTKRLIPGLL